MSEKYQFSASDDEITQINGMTSVQYEGETLICIRDFCNHYEISRDRVTRKLKDNPSYKVLMPNRRYLSFMTLQEAENISGDCLTNNSTYDFSPIKTVTHTTFYKLNDTLISVKNNDGVRLISLDNVYELTNTPNQLTKHFINCPKTYYKTIDGKKERMRCTSVESLYDAVKKEKFENREILEQFLESLCLSGKEKTILKTETTETDQSTEDESADPLASVMNPLLNLVNQIVCKQSDEKESETPDKTITEKLVDSLKFGSVIDRENEFKTWLSNNMNGSVPLGTTMVCSPSDQNVFLNSIWTAHCWKGKKNEWNKAKQKADMFSVSRNDLHLNPASSYVWMKCPASATASAMNKRINLWKHLEKSSNTRIDKREDLDERISNFMASQHYSQNIGNIRHNVASSLIKSLILKEPMTPEETLEFTKNFGKETAVLDYVRFAIEDFKNGEYTECFIEESLDLPFIEFDVKGRMDLMFRKEGKIKIIDFKSGDDRIPAFGNSQLMIYGFGYLSHHGFDENLKEIELQIVQPTLGNYESVVVTPENLIKWGYEVLLPKARKSINPSIDDFHYGEWCSVCTCKDCRLRKWIEQNEIQGEVYDR